MAEQQKPPVFSKWIGVVGLFVAPTTVITSLCYFYGYVATRKYFDYFGIDTDALGFTTADYVTRSIRALYVPVIAGLVTYVTLLWAIPFLRRRIEVARPGTIRRTGWAAVGLGILATGWAILSLTKPEWAQVHIDALTPVALAVGSASLGVGLWVLTARRSAVEPGPFAAAQRASLVAVVGAIVVALFWIVDIFAIAYGEDQAEIKRNQLWSQETNVVLDTESPLLLPVRPGQLKVAWVPPADSAAKAIFLRYECFRALAVRGDRWVLVPARWTPEEGFAVIVDAGSSNVISVRRSRDIAGGDPAKNWDDRTLECLEVAGRR